MSDDDTKPVPVVKTNEMGEGGPNGDRIGVAENFCFNPGSK